MNLASRSPDFVYTLLAFPSVHSVLEYHSLQRTFFIVRQFRLIKYMRYVMGCVPAQFSRFADIAHGKKTDARSVLSQRIC
ncbi:hypothetical protein BDV11DRAFT_179326 [Aspergillus similis]